MPAPASIHEIDNGRILGFGENLSEDHPGFHDEEYKRRRVLIAQAARLHRMCVYSALEMGLFAAGFA
jgi:hypothetical protein